MSHPISPYTIPQRVFRTGVFQNGVGHSSLELFLIGLILGCKKKTCHPKMYDPARAEQGLAVWKRLGAETFTTTPDDGEAEIQGVFWHPRDLEARLNEHGARWEKFDIMDKGEKLSIIAIITPKEPTEGWSSLEEDILKFRWEKRQVTTIDGETLEVIITCQEAEDLNPEEFGTKVFLHSNSASVTYIMLRKRAAFYLGMKQPLCFYDPRGSGLSKGIPSEGGYYLDILAVYRKLRALYEADQIWVSGACLGTNAAAFLKVKTEESFNLILENGCMDFKRDFIGNENCIVRLYAELFGNGILAKERYISEQNIETGFSVEAMWKSEEQLAGKVVIVGVENDQRLPPIVRYKNIKFAQKMSESVYPIIFRSPKKDGHFDRYFNHVETRRKMIRVLNGIKPEDLSTLQPPVQEKTIPLQLILVAIALVGIALVVTACRIY